VTQSVGCTYAIAPDQQNADATGGSATVTVTAPGGCGWTAAANASWISVSSGASGSGNGTVRLTIAANPGAARSGTATIAGRTFTVNQGLACSFAIAPDQQTVDPGGGTATVTVTSPAGCAWTAAANVP